MANERDDRTDPAADELSPEELKRRLDEEERRLSEVELSEAEARALAASGDDTLIARAASLAIRKVEQQKDSPEAMGSAITQKYLQLGSHLLRDAGGQQLQGALRERVSRVMGQDPGDVRIHTGERAQQAADALGARAFAVGNSDVYFGRDEFRPDTSEGFGVLVHELAHVTDNQVGAAFHTSSGGADYSEAESRAEAAQRTAVRSEGEESTQEDSGLEELSPATVDMRQLEDAVDRLVKRSQRLGADRSGASGG